MKKRRRRDGERKRNEIKWWQETRTWRAKRNEAGDDFLDKSWGFGWHERRRLHSCDDLHCTLYSNSIRLYTDKCGLYLNNNISTQYFFSLLLLCMYPHCIHLDLIRIGNTVILTRSAGDLLLLPYLYYGSHHSGKNMITTTNEEISRIPIKQAQLIWLVVFPANEREREKEI